MKLTEFSWRGRTVTLMAATTIALSVLTACSSGTNEHASAASAIEGTAVSMPSLATYIVDMPEHDGTTMTMAVTVEGDKVVAYATNGINDEAYFFGTQKDGQMELTSMYADDVKASFDGTQLIGEMTMNENDAAQMKFAASPVSAPAGIYTATHDATRVSVVVRPDHTMVGVMDNRAPGNHRVTDALAAHDQAFKDQVRQMRLDRQLQPAPRMTYGTMSMHVGGATMTAVRVTGGMTI